jgi:hypothetical protein
MRLLGFVFVIVLAVLAVGYFRGWYSVTTTHAGGKSEVTVGVDQDRIHGDANSAAAHLGKLSAEAVEAVKSLGRRKGPDASELDSTLTAVDLQRRCITVTASAQAIEFQVPAALPITRAGLSVAFADLLVGTRVQLSIDHIGDDQVLSRIEVLR